jgi:hypothetical protein
MRRIGVAVLLFAVACDDAPTKPSPRTVKPQPPPPFYVRCEPQGMNVECTAWLAGEGDVTIAAQWSGFEFSGNTFTEANDSDAVSFPTAGVAVPAKPANLYIRARYISQRWGFYGPFIARTLYSYGFDPKQPVAVLANFIVCVKERSSAGPWITGARIELGLPDGQRRERINEIGCVGFEHVPIATPLLIRASKAAYAPYEARHPGIQRGEFGPTSITHDAYLIPSTP